MKTLKTIILSLATVLTISAANAKTIKTSAEKMSVNYAISVYVNAIAHGQIAALSEVLDDNSKFTMLRGKNMLSANKTEMLTFLKTTENVNQDCKIAVSTNETNADITVVKVEMKYAGFTRTNYVTLANTSEGWKISSVYSVFKS